MSDLRFFEELGIELERVARSRQRTATARAARRPTGIVVIVLLVLAVAGVAAAAVVLIPQGKPLPAPPAGILGPTSQPTPGSVRLAGLNAPDPSGGPSWDVRLSRSRTGEICTSVGQIVRGQFGIVGLDGVFRRLALGGVDACGVPGIAGPALAGARVFAGASEGQARTVVNGVAGAGTRSVTVYGPGGARHLRLGPQGSFITVYTGYVEDVRPRIVIVEQNGRTETINLGNSLFQQAADPAGGPPWDVLGGASISPGSTPDEECVHLQRESSPQEPGVPAAPRNFAFPPFIGASTPEYCGRLAAHPLFVAMERFDPGEQQNGQWYWQQNPARTILYGSAAPRVSALSLVVGGGTPRPVAINRDDGAFAVVLDGHTSPSSLVLIARLRDGQTITFDRPANLLNGNGRPVRSLPEPAYRAPQPIQAQPPPRPVAPIMTTVQESLHATDPSGGPAWTLESWQATPAPHIRAGGPLPRRFFCENAGVLEGGQLVLPSLNSPATPLSIHDEPCETPHPATLINEVYVNTLDSYAPTPVRDIVFGFVKPGSTDLRLSAPGITRALPIDRNGAFLTVLPGRFWDTALRITALSPTGQRETATDRPQGTAPPLAIAPDPAGGPPWGFRAGPNNFEMNGQVLDNKLVSLQPNGMLAAGPDDLSSGGVGPLPTPSPLDLYPDLIDLFMPTTTTTAEIERRTLPGTTLIAGLAAPDVVSITLTTPRDVRTLAPTGSDHAFVAAYDGFFYDAAVSATVRLRNGTTRTIPIPQADYPTPGFRAAGQTLNQLLADIEHNARQDLRHLHGPQARQIATSIQLRIKTLQVLLAYRRAHPTLLPPN